MRFTIGKSLLALAIFAAAISAPQAEVFRTRKTVCLSVPARGSSESKACGINDCVAAFLPEDTTFAQGVEITVKIPQALAAYRNTIIYSIYNNITPVPTEKGIDYSGTEIYSGLYPGQLAWTIAIPLVKGNTMKASPYADKTLIPDASRGFVFLRNQLAMKGVPKSVMEAEFEVSAKAVLADYGALKVLAPADSGEYTVYVDEKPVTANEKGLVILKPGKRNVSIVSEKFRNETRAVMIAQGEVTELSLALQSVAPSVHVRAPEGTKIFVDGNEVQAGEALALEAGEHIFKFNLGGYEVTKKVAIQNGKSYNVSVNVDASVKEE